jgi:hypothetical protein
MVQPDPQHQQGHRRRGQVHHQHNSVRQVGIIAEAEADRRDHAHGQRHRGRSEPSAARRRAAHLSGS